MYSKLAYYAMIFLLPLYILVVATKVWAQEEYVLPYPGFMPGHPLYKLSEFIDQIQELWSFGSLSSFKYNLSMADKKLIEAKTLFEYKQYLLATKSLLRYEEHFNKASFLLSRAESEGKDISKQRAIFTSARKKHVEVLEKLKSELPEEFVWTPEKGTPERLKIRKLIDDAINN